MLPGRFEPSRQYHTFQPRHHRPLYDLPGVLHRKKNSIQKNYYCWKRIKSSMRMKKNCWMKKKENLMRMS
jgi:hypothetical protein